jgi:preprotein translocase subunit SecA
MNTQRQVIYGQRRKVLDGEDLALSVQHMLDSFVELEVGEVLMGAPIADEAQANELLQKFEGVYFPVGSVSLTVGMSTEDAVDAILLGAKKTYAEKTEAYTPAVMREAERVFTLRVVDEYWMDHLDAMTELRQGVALRAFGQVDPVVVYKKEGFEMFSAMNDAIRAEIIRRLFAFRLKTQEELKREQVAKITSEGGAGDGTVKRQPVVKKDKIGRNDPCPCGSGKKYKNCCLDKDLNGK